LVRKCGLDVATVAINACILLIPVPGNVAEDTALREFKCWQEGHGPTSVGRILRSVVIMVSQTQLHGLSHLRGLNPKSKRRVREIAVSGGKVLSEQTLPLLEEIRSTPAAGTGTLKIDSNQALRIASVQEKKTTGVVSLYEL
jgi:hypothetical protein